MNKMEIFYNANQAAKIIGISKGTLLRYERLRKIPSALRNPINRWRQYRTQDIKKIIKLLGRE